MYKTVFPTNRVLVVNILWNGALRYSTQAYLRVQGEGERSERSPVRSRCRERAASACRSLRSVLRCCLVPQAVSHAHVHPKGSDWHQSWVAFTKRHFKNRRINNFALEGGTADIGMHWHAETETLAHKHPFWVPAYKCHHKPADEGFVQHIWHPYPKMELLSIYRFV